MGPGWSVGWLFGYLFVFALFEQMVKMEFGDSRQLYLNFYCAHQESWRIADKVLL